MDFIFADDSRQQNPSRPGMGPLVAIGGIHVPGNQVSSLERGLRSHCDAAGFPHNEQFKWSPGRKEAFEREKLKGTERTNFYHKEPEVFACNVRLTVAQ